LSLFDNKLLIGTQYGLVLSTDGEKITLPLSTPVNSSTSYLHTIKPIATDRILIGYYDGSHHYIKYADIYPRATAGANTALYKAGYTDFGQKIKINYVKFYFKPLVSGDSITVGLDVDYGTAKTLGKGTGNISYTVDGVITSKKFSNLGFQCHAFRPVITWATGAVAISKIVVDYSFISD
jgi:hypothetical protein